MVMKFMAGKIFSSSRARSNALEISKRHLRAAMTIDEKENFDAYEQSKAVKAASSKIAGSLNGGSKYNSRLPMVPVGWVK